MHATPHVPVFDGHNDTLLHVHLPERGRGRSFLERSGEGHVDLPRAREGGLAGGVFAVFVPAESLPGGPAPAELVRTEEGYEVPEAPPMPQGHAEAFTWAVVERLRAWEAAGAVRVVRGAGELEAAFAGDAVAAVLHLEGAEAIRPDLSNLGAFCDAGLRSLGVVWSRRNAFGHGVPFRYPGSPDAGPGLTKAGRRLVEACNARGVVVDLAHLNARGFRDVARVSEAPLVVSHAGAHAVCPSSRNLTDDQLEAVAASGGVVGVTFAVAMVRRDGANDAATPLGAVVDHVDHVAEVAGVDHVALGSDFDGAVIPEALGDAAGLPRLLDALERRGYSRRELERIAHKNWLRVLRETWRA